jgi:CO dehydrogenase maturation factor
LAATLARLYAKRGCSVLAIDGDPNPNLGVALGVAAPGLAELQPVPRTILEEHADPSGATQLALVQPIETIACDHGVPAPDGVTLLLAGRVDHAGAG